MELEDFKILKAFSHGLLVSPKLQIIELYKVELCITGAPPNSGDQSVFTELQRLGGGSPRHKYVLCQALDTFSSSAADSIVYTPFRELLAKRYSMEPVNVTLFEKRVFVDVTKLRIST